MQTSLYLPATLTMWFLMTLINVALSKLPSDTQAGSWLCQTSVWQWICLPEERASATTSSAPLNEKLFRVGSTTSHFMAFSGVTDPNSAGLSMMARSVASLRIVTAVPKKLLPCALIAWLRPDAWCGLVWLVSVRFWPLVRDGSGARAFDVGMVLEEEKEMDRESQLTTSA